MNLSFAGLLKQLCTILMASGVPADVLTEVSNFFLCSYASQLASFTINNTVNVTTFILHLFCGRFLYICATFETQFETCTMYLQKAGYTL